ncbi:FUSC family protein [Cerasicoccus maritimus]|uniref:FUSC family protein n=1 Tax=Cerasicoccus maritimus TaxID=490089 RepID=UPI0028528432|nr:FUSC family protein [Cerasicoccus maritimus]
MLSTRAKEAIKPAVAIVITYWIALSASWMNPHWAAMTVALVALPTVDETVKKGLERLLGTIPGCLVALVILVIAANERWLLVFLASSWIFVATYLKQVDKERAYFWQIAGVVSLIILASSTSSTAYFMVAMYRTLETGMGVLVYGLVTLFLWPQRSQPGDAKKAPPAPPRSSRFSGLSMLMLDRDLFMRTLFAALCPLVGGAIWIYFDPPGHSGWFMIMGSLGMAIAAMPFMRASMLVIPLGVFLGAALMLSIFVLPLLESFSQLAVLLFVLFFANYYFLKGVPRILGAVAIVMELSIRNQQVYNFPAMANMYFFILMAFIAIYFLTYLLGSGRPEKQVLHYLRRYFNAAAHLTSKDYGQKGWTSRLSDAYYLREVQSIPLKIMPWVKSIKPKACPDNTAEKTDPLLQSLMGLSQQLFAQLNEGYGNDKATEALHRKVETAFLALSKRPESSIAVPSASLSGQLCDVWQSVQSYVQAAQGINWSQWREERFS